MRLKCKILIPDLRNRWWMIFAKSPDLKHAWFVGKSLMVKSERYGKPHLHKPKYTRYTDIVPFPFQRRTRFVNASGTNEIEAKLVVATFVKGRYHNT